MSSGFDSRRLHSSSTWNVKALRATAARLLDVYWSITWVLVLAISSPCRADTWAVATLGSHHFNERRHYEQLNYGLGFEATTARDRLSWIGGEYRNSFDRTSVYAGLAWTPLALGPAHFGILGGVLTGYRPRPVMPMALPTAQAEFGRVGANLYFAPKIKDGAAVLGLQVKFRF